MKSPSPVPRRSSNSGLIVASVAIAFMIGAIVIVVIGRFPALVSSPSPTDTAAHSQPASSVSSSAQPGGTGRPPAVPGAAGPGSTAVVQVSSGDYEAAAVDQSPTTPFDQSKTITFWRSHGGGPWQQAGSSSYPVSDGVPVTVTGGSVENMPDAVFAVHGSFGYDVSSDAVAFTTGADGKWSVIQELPNGNIGASGQPATDTMSSGLEYGIYFRSGLMESARCSITLPIDQCGGPNLVLKFWRGNGQAEMVLDHRAGLPR